jgi:ribosome-binding ATPase
MTSVKDAPRGKGDVAIGISKVPDSRLDSLTAMYNPRKRVPATVEFTDLIAPARSGAQGLVDVAGYKNADALVHVVRAFRDEAVPHPSGSVNPARDAQAMEDELLLADLGVAERRLERIERDLKKAKTPDLEKEREIVHRCKDALEQGTPLRALQLAGDDLKRLRGFQFLSAKPLLLVINLDEADVATSAPMPQRLRPGPASRRSATTRRRERWRCARKSSSRSRSSKGATSRRFWPISA